MLQIPLQAVPSQTLTVALNDQNVQLKVYQKSFGLFIDVYVNDVLIIAGVICQNLNRILRDAYLGFVGDFVFFDTLSDANQLGSDPVYTGLDSQFQLLYLDEADLQ